MRAQITDHDYELLSAYMDGQLSSSEQTRLEERLRTRPELQTTLDDLRRTRTMLRAAPRRKAPRSFTLTPAMAASVRPQRSRFFHSLFPGLSFASALAAFVLIATIVFELLPGSVLTTASQPQMEAPAAAETTMEDAARDTGAGSPEEMGIQSAPAAEMEAAPSEKSAGPPSITWNDPSAPPVTMDASPYAQAPRAYGMGGGGGDGMGGMGGAGWAQPFVLPLEAVESLDGAAEAPAAVALPESSPAFAGGGPILGVPPVESQGKVIVKSSWGAPLEGAGADAAAGDPNAVVPGETARGAPFLGLPVWRWFQIVLGALALATGAAAFLLYRRRAG